MLCVHLFPQNPIIKFALASFCDSLKDKKQSNRFNILADWKSYLIKENSRQWCTVSGFEESYNVSHAPFQRVTVQLQLFSNFHLDVLDRPPSTKRIPKILHMQRTNTPLCSPHSNIQLLNKALPRAQISWSAEPYRVALCWGWRL